MEAHCKLPSVGWTEWYACDNSEKWELLWRDWSSEGCKEKCDCEGTLRNSRPICPHKGKLSDIIAQSHAAI